METSDFRVFAPQNTAALKRRGAVEEITITYIV